MMITAGQILSGQYLLVPPGTTIGRAVEQMIDKSANALLVRTPESGEGSPTGYRLAGTVPEAILLRAAIDTQLRNDPVSLHMDRQFAYVSEQAPLDVVLDQFVLHDLQYLPVLDEGRLSGIVTRGDLLRVAFRNRPASFGILGA